MSCAPPPSRVDTIDLVSPSSDIGHHNGELRRNHPSSYVSRRWAFFSASDRDAPFDAVDMSAISRLPLSLQVSFRIKMFSIFALQLLVVWVIVGVFRFQPDAKALVDHLFNPPVAGAVIVSVVSLLLLAALYAARDRFPLNWLLLLLFTAAQSFSFVAVGVVLDSSVGFFNCAFSFACVVLMIALSGVRHRQRRGGNDGGESGGASSEEEGSLLTSLAAGAIAYVVVAVAACVLFAVCGTEYMTIDEFEATLAFQFALILWFAYDASSMYQLMSPDEYMHGLIYFYTDLIVLAIVVLAITGMVALLAARGEHDGNHCNCDSCNCDSCVDPDACAATVRGCFMCIDCCANCCDHDRRHHNRHHHHSTSTYPDQSIRHQEIPAAARGLPVPSAPDEEDVCDDCTDKKKCPKHYTPDEKTQLLVA